MGGGGSRRFVPVRIDFVVDEREDGQKPKYIWTQLRYEKKEEGQINKLCEKLLKGARGDYFKLHSDDGDQVVLTSRSRKQLKHSKKNWATVYANICRDYEKFALFSLLSRDGYRYYVNLYSPMFPQLCYPVLLCFYVGTLSRYRPRTLEEVMASSLGPIINESLTLCPRQFLYQVAGVVTNQVVVVPQASI